VVAVVEGLGSKALQNEDAHRLLQTIHTGSLGAEEFSRYRLQQVPDYVRLTPKGKKADRRGWLERALSGRYQLNVEQLNTDSGLDLTDLAKLEWNMMLTFVPRRHVNVLGFEITQSKRDFHEVLGGAHVLDQATAGVRAMMGRHGKIILEAGHDLQPLQAEVEPDRLEVEAGHVVLGLGQLLAKRLGYDLDQIGFRTALFSGDSLVMGAGPWTGDAQRGLLGR
jgi:hypothetical protein